MYNLRSPAEAYRKVDFDARIAGADPGQLVVLCYEQLATALGSAVYAAEAGDNARKSAALTRALAALTALQLGLDHGQPIAVTLATLFESARHTVLDSVIQFDAAALTRLKQDVAEIAGALRSAANLQD
jgi:flagellar biosynthetic protein FliS